MLLSFAPFTAHALFFHLKNRCQHPLTIDWNDLLEFWKVFCKVIQGSSYQVRNWYWQHVLRSCSLNSPTSILVSSHVRYEPSSLLTSCIEIIFHIQYISDTAAHAASRSFYQFHQEQLHARLSYIHIRDLRHLPQQLLPELRTANRSPATPLMNTLPICRTVECNVTDDDILFGFITDSFRRICDKFTT